MSTWRNTEYDEIAMASPNEKWGSGGSSVQRTIDIFDGSAIGRVQAAYDLLGYGVINNTGSGPFVHRVIPMAYAAVLIGEIKPSLVGDTVLPPDLTNKLFAVAITRTQPVAAPTGIDVTALPLGSVASDYERARLTLEYSTLPYAVLDDATLVEQGGVFNGNPDEGVALAGGWSNSRYISRHREEFTQTITIPYGIMRSNAPTKNASFKLIKKGIPFRMGGEHRYYTWMRVPLSSNGVSGVNWGRIEGALNTINSALFDGAPPQTLLFVSLSSREYQGAFGEWLADVTFHFMFLPNCSSGSRYAAWQNVTIGDPSVPMPRGYDFTGALVPLMEGVTTGWNSIPDVDFNGDWDYYAVTTATTNNTPGQPPFQTNDFSTFFRP